MKRAVALFLSIVALGFGVVYILRAEKAESGKVSELYAQVEPLERERQSLQEELSELESSYALKTRDYGTIELLFPWMTEEIYTSAYPIMRDLDIVGVIGISPLNLPNQWGNLTVDEINRLLLEGWGLCLMYEGAWADFTTWYDNYKQYMMYFDVPLPTAVYFPNDDYDSSMDEQIIACGLDTVILNASNGRDGTVTDTSAPLWKTGAMPLNYTGFATDVELIGRTDGSNLCFVVDMGNPMSPTYIPWSMQDPENPETPKAVFRQTLESWLDMLYVESPLDELDKVSARYISGDSDEAMQQLYMESLTTDQQLLLAKFRVVNLENAKGSHTLVSQGNEENQNELEAKKADLQDRIDELDEQIRGLYDAFTDSNDNMLLMR